MLALAKADHVLDELPPEKKKSAFGVAEMTILGEVDDAVGEVMLELAAHFPFNGIFDFLGIGDAQMARSDFHPAQIPLVIT